MVYSSFKNGNPVSQIIKMLPKFNQKKIYNKEMSTYCKVHVNTQHLECFYHLSRRRGMEVICTEAQVALIVADSAACVFLIFLTLSHRFSLAFRSD